jgi:hypothetical protein
MDYTEFYGIFLTEMPMRLNGSNNFQAQLQMVRENLLINPVVVSVTPQVYKTQNAQQITYWMGDSGTKTVDIIVDITVHNSFAKVVLSSKNPEIQPGKPPYTIIKNDLHSKNLVLASDRFLYVLSRKPRDL